MKNRILWLFLALSLVSLGACVNRSTSGSSNTLVHGLNQSGAESSPASTVDMVKVVKATPGVIAIYGGKSTNISQGMSVPSNAILRSNAKGRATLAFPMEPQLMCLPIRKSPFPMWPQL